MSPPVEPPPTQWALPEPTVWPDSDLVAVGADLEPGTVLAAYRRGLFPMPHPGRRRSALGWWSPDPRGVIPLDGLRWPRSLRSATRRFTLRVDSRFDDVVDRCADPRRPHGWISPEIQAAYSRLHRLGWAHSVEAWTSDGRLAGGLYGLSVGGLFAGESMWHEPEPFGRDASKVALVGLVSLLRRAGHTTTRLLDVQWATPHLVTLGAVPLERLHYLARLREATGLPQPEWTDDAARPDV